MNVERCPKCFHPFGSPGSHEICMNCGFDLAANEPPESVLPWGTMLQGRYIIGQTLGEGGFGITYLGFDTNLQYKVAIKEYFPRGVVYRDSTRSLSLKWPSSTINHQNKESGCERFLSEARKMARVGYIPYIVRVIDTFRANETSYIIMDYVDGITLQKYMKQFGPMPLKTCLDLVLPLFSSIDSMHKMGMFHRDISPDNIIINNRDKMAWLLDFGSTKDTGASGPSSIIVAKKGFSPVEQYTGKNIGPWTDVYSTCATIYYCITGNTLTDAYERLMDPDISWGTANIPEKVRQALEHGLALQFKNRIQSMDELKAALTEALGDKDASADPGSSPDRIDIRDTSGNAAAATGTESPSNASTAGTSDSTVSAGDADTSNTNTSGGSMDTTRDAESTNSPNESDTTVNTDSTANCETGSADTRDAADNRSSDASISRASAETTSDIEDTISPDEPEVAAGTDNIADHDSISSADSPGTSDSIGTATGTEDTGSASKPDITVRTDNTVNADSTDDIGSVTNGTEDNSGADIRCAANNDIRSASTETTSDTEDTISPDEPEVAAGTDSSDDQDSISSADSPGTSDSTGSASIDTTSGTEDTISPDGLDTSANTDNIADQDNSSSADSIGTAIKPDSIVSTENAGAAENADTSASSGEVGCISGTASPAPDSNSGTTPEPIVFRTEVQTGSGAGEAETRKDPGTQDGKSKKAFGLPHKDKIKDKPKPKSEDKGKSKEKAKDKGKEKVKVEKKEKVKSENKDRKKSPILKIVLGAALLLVIVGVIICSRLIIRVGNTAGNNGQNAGASQAGTTKATVSDTAAFLSALENDDVKSILIDSGTHIEIGEALEIDKQVTVSEGCSFFCFQPISILANFALDAESEFFSNSDVTLSAEFFVASQSLASLEGCTMTVTADGEIYVESLGTVSSREGATILVNGGLLTVDGYLFSDNLVRTVNGGSITTGQYGTMELNTLWLANPNDLTGRGQVMAQENRTG